MTITADTIQRTEQESPRGKASYSYKPYQVYKPNGRGRGGAIQFCPNPSKQAVFVEAANQCGDRKFDWEQKIIMKWGLADIGAVLAVLQKRLPEAKLFHQTEKASSALAMTFQPFNPNAEDSRPAFYSMTLSRQDAHDKSVSKVKISLLESEAALLEIVLQNAVAEIFGY